MRRFVFVLLASAILILPSCENARQTAIDREVERLLNQEREYSLGPDQPYDRRPIPDRVVDDRGGNDQYRTKLKSRNPLAADLPARPATTRPSTRPATQPSTEVPADAMSLNLERALSYAIANAPEYRNRKEELFLASLNLLIERHLWGPRFFDTITAQARGTPESGDHEQAVDLINSFGVTQRLPYGGSVSAGALVTFTEQLRLASNNDTQTAQLFLTGNLPLLRGAGQAAREDLIQAERNLVYAGRAFENFRREFLVDISTRYYDLLRKQSEIQNVRRQLENFEWLERRTAAFARAGRIAVFEVQRAEQESLFARNNLIIVRDQYTSQVDAFKLLLGIPTDQPLIIEPSEVVLPEPAIDPEEAVASAIKYRLDLQTLSDRVDDARRRIDVAKNTVLPDVNLFADLRGNTDPLKRRPNLKIAAGASTYAAGVEVGLPLDRRIEELQVRQATVDYERAARTFTLESNRVVLDVRQSIRAIEQARLSLELQSRNIEVADRRLRGVLLRLATLGPRDFIEAQDRLLQARNRRDQALRDLRVSILNYLLDTGQMRITSDGHWQPPGKLVVTATAVQEQQSDNPQAIDPGVPQIDP